MVQSLEVNILKKKVAALLIVIIILLNMTACKLQNKMRYETEFLGFFDTITMVECYSDNKEEFNEYAEYVYNNLKELHELFDIYNNYDGINNLKTINDNAGIKPVKVDKNIIDLLKFTKEAYNLTNGKVNVAFGAVLEVWHDYRADGTLNPEHATLPPMDILKEKARHTDINKVIIDENLSTVYLEDSKMSLDVGAIAKGYATEKVSDLAREAGYSNGLLSVGGNVRTVGDKGDSLGSWNVGIQNPDLNSIQTNLFVLNLKDLSLVTSGTYQRFYTVDGKEYHHIIDPLTLMPSEYFTAVTIVCEESGIADALSTGVFNMPYEDGKKLIESLPNTEAVWVFKNGDIKYSKNFNNLIKK